MNRSLNRLGGTLLIVGTSLGGGMLALPIAVAKLGFPLSCCYLVSLWGIMTFCALLTLEVNLALPMGSNIISMVDQTCGRGGRWVAWFGYLCLLYLLLAAYLSGGSEILVKTASLLSIHLSYDVSTVLFMVVMGSIIASGLLFVEKANAVLMIIKFLLIALMLLSLLPYVSLTQLGFSGTYFTLQPVGLLITAFGYAIVIPSLRTSFRDQEDDLRRVIIVGSSIPLVCYLLWNSVIMGVVPVEGNQGLLVMQHADYPTLKLTDALVHFTQNRFITALFRIFTGFSLLTTFLGVGLSAVDFLADGCRLNKHGCPQQMVFALAFLPPLLLVYYEHDVFLAAMQYAGIFVVLLLITLPVLMAYQARYRVKLAGSYQVKGGKLSLILVGLLSLFLLAITFEYHL